MPIYEYLCQDCNRKMSFLVLRPSEFQPVCKHCKGNRLEQLFSRFAMPKSEDKRLDSLADPSTFAGLDESDPSSVARWMKKMGKEMGEDFGEDIDQIAEEAAEEAAHGAGEGAAPAAETADAAVPPVSGPSDDL
jgi:putative FmdB family regulatory protein